MPIGTFAFALIALLALIPIRRPQPLATASWILTCGVNELPLTFLAISVVSTVPSLTDGVSGGSERATIAVAALTFTSLLVVATRALRSRRVLRRALADQLGVTVRPGRAPWWERIPLIPWLIRPLFVSIERGVPYGNEPHHRLDVYRSRRHERPGPTFIHLHGGRFRWGRRSRESRPLLHRLAREGWTCISADYHLSQTPAEGFPHHLVDVKRILAWVRNNGFEHGAEPEPIVLAGSSAGAHLTAMAALTTDDPRFQPGFEDANTEITAGVGFYGYYGSLGAHDGPSDPISFAGPHAPPFLIVHGDHDTYAPVEGARRFVSSLRVRSRNPVVLAELPGAQHSFDLFHSLRFTAVVDTVAAFAEWSTTRGRNRMGRKVRHSLEGGDAAGRQLGP